MSRLEVLCVTMYQNDFSIVNKLNLKCDAVISNQTDNVSFVEKTYQWGNVKLISTMTRGVGKNRNNAFLFATGDILLLSDDDMCYSDTYVEDILDEFDDNPYADVIIFNINSSDINRKQYTNTKTKQIGYFSHLPYGAPRIAIRKSSWERANVWFTNLFGGGAKYSNGEDSIFLNDLIKKGLKIFVSSKTIGHVDLSQSSWYKGTNEEYFFNKGAYCVAVKKWPCIIYCLYHALRVKSQLPILDRIKSFNSGVYAYKYGLKYDDTIDLKRRGKDCGLK